MADNDKRRICSGNNTKAELQVLKVDSEATLHPGITFQVDMFSGLTGKYFQRIYLKRLRNDRINKILMRSDL